MKRPKRLTRAQKIAASVAQRLNPPPGDNRFLSIDGITKQALNVLKNNLRFARFVNADYSKPADHGKTGNTINIRMPFRYRTAK